MTFWGDERFRDAHLDSSEDTSHAHDQHGTPEPHESPWIMTVPLIVLAVLSTVGGFIGVPYALSSFFTERNVNVIEQTLEPVVAHACGNRRSQHSGVRLLLPSIDHRDVLS